MIELREFLKISSLGFIDSLIPKVVLGLFGPVKMLSDREKLDKLPKLSTPRTIEELIAMLEAEFPSKFNSIDFNPDKQWEAYYKLNKTPELPIVLAKIKYENPRQSKVKILDTGIYDEQWESDSLKIEREYIQKVYFQIKSDVKKLKASSVNWRIKPEIERFVYFEKRTVTKRLYARVIFI